MKKAFRPLWNVMRREVQRMCNRQIYFWTMIVVPVIGSLYFMSLLNEGLPLRAPSAIVDCDHSSMSRQLYRSLDAMELVDLQYKLESFHDALEMVNSGKIMGFFYIPQNFQRDAVGGRTPTLTYYTNMTYFVPGTLSYKAFKTMAVTTSGGIVQTKLVSLGATTGMAGTILQPMIVQDHELGNPWMNYSIYLSNSFTAGLIELMVMLVTAFSIGQEIKRGTSVDWLQTADGSMFTAIMGKLIPQFVIFAADALFVMMLLYKWFAFPLNGSTWALIGGMMLMIVACQWLAVWVTSTIVNLRLSVASMSLMGILAFSIAAFSFPVESMYGACAIFSYILPVRYYFLIYSDIALNGLPIYYSRVYFAALLAFPLIGSTMLWHLKKACLKPVYVP